MPISIRAEPAIVKRKNFVAAYALFPWPQRPMRKYIGTITTSKQRKKTIRSMAQNTPITPASSSSIQAK